KIWSEYKYGNLDQWIKDQLVERTYDLYFLTSCDVPWEYDSQRENPHDRKVLFDRYRDFLKECNVPFHVLEGNQEQRLEEALQIISDL
ncbi:MAG: AAA family ATPase, partial [Bacteroidota bacterium]